jgi:hypothetical protein
MRTITTLLLFAGLCLAQTPLTSEEKLAIENASLKLQLLDVQKADVQKQAQAVFEGACKRAGIEVSACQFDQKALTISKAEPPKPAPAKPEAKK